MQLNDALIESYGSLDKKNDRSVSLDGCGLPLCYVACLLLLLFLSVVYSSRTECRTASMISSGSCSIQLGRGLSVVISCRAANSKV